MRFFSTLDKRRAVTIVGVLVVAFLCGHVMQNVLVAPIPVASVPPTQDAAPVLKTLKDPKPLPVPPAATLVPILDRPAILPKRVEEALIAKDAKVVCAPKLFATSAPAAMVTLVLHAPCHAQRLVEIEQGPITASAYLDADGRMTLKVPALTEDVLITVRFDDVVLDTSLTVPEAENFQHVSLMWAGQQVLKLNAFEFGAARNEIGHVWSGAPKSPTRASRGSGGFMTRLVTKDGPSAEIYSLPVGQSPLSGVVRLVVEADVTAASCGRVVKAKALQPTAFRRLSEIDVEVALPDCDRQGDVVLLQNLLRDVRLAAR